MLFGRVMDSTWTCHSVLGLFSFVLHWNQYCIWSLSFSLDKLSIIMCYLLGLNRLWMIAQFFIICTFRLMFVIHSFWLATYQEGCCWAHSSGGRARASKGQRWGKTLHPWEIITHLYSWLCLRSLFFSFLFFSFYLLDLSITTAYFLF